jgi:FlaA1/EpsC-like NDP-sugar epimerase
MNLSATKGATLLITGGTGSFGHAVLDKCLLRITLLKYAFSVETKRYKPMA